MKKTYQMPTTVVVNIKTEQMMVTSLQMYGKDATGEALSREADLWDDEDY